MPAGSSAPIIYASCIRGTSTGFWKSTNGGVDWTNYPVLPNGGQASAVNQQFYPAIVDPYDASHLPHGRPCGRSAGREHRRRSELERGSHRRRHEQSRRDGRPRVHRQRRSGCHSQDVAVARLAIRRHGRHLANPPTKRQRLDAGRQERAHQRRQRKVARLPARHLGCDVPWPGCTPASGRACSAAATMA